MNIVTISNIIITLIIKLIIIIIIIDEVLELDLDGGATVSDVKREVASTMKETQKQRPFLLEHK